MFSHPDPPLTDGIVVLRELRDSDLPAVIEAMQDPLIRRFLSGLPWPYGEAEAQAFYEKTRADAEDGMYFTIADASDPAVVLGAIGLHDLSRTHLRVSTGYWVAPWARGRGLAQRALQLVSEWALRGLGLVRVQLVADVDNSGSQRVAVRSGFVREGILHRHSVMGGVSRDVVMYGRWASADAS